MMICRLDVVEVSLLHLIRERCKRNIRIKELKRRNTWDLTFRVDAAEETATTITELNGVNYKGPELASYRRGKLGRLISPFFPLGEDQGGNLLNGRTWEMVWENVDFPISGNYDFRFEVDDVYYSVCK